MVTEATRLVQSEADVEAERDEETMEKLKALGYVE